MSLKKIFIILAVVVLVAVVWLGFVLSKKAAYNDPSKVLSFEACIEAGYPVMESYPRQCKTPDGRTYAEEVPIEITYNNSSRDLIEVENPFPGAVTGKTFSVIGRARGGWFFEASFLVKVLDDNGNVLAAVPAQAQGDWMTSDFVPFIAEISVPVTYIGPATLVLEKDNPSGLIENDASISFPFTIEY
jgi:hypothetical protein